MKACRQNGYIAIHIVVFLTLALVEEGRSGSGSGGFTPGGKINNTH
jgi:hypothetical protein